MTNKVLVTRKIHKEAIELMKKSLIVDVWDSDEPISRTELLKRVKGVGGIFCTISDQIDKEVIESAGTSLKIIGSMSVGTEHISTLTCSKKGIFVSTTGGIAGDCAAELTCTLLLTVARRCMEGQTAVRNGTWGLWKPMWLCGPEFTGRTLGIAGFGHVGFGVARRMKNFGLKRTIYYDLAPTPMADDMGLQFVDFQTLLKESDFLVVCLSLNGSTRGLFNKDVFKKMKNSAIFINSSRGQIVNTDDLAEALASGELYAAGLDVTDPEPLPSYHPLVKMHNCVITPHLGTNGKSTRLEMALDTARNILSTLK